MPSGCCSLQALAPTRFADTADNNIPFAIRLREDLRVTTEDGCELTLRARLRCAGRTRFFQARLGTRDGAGSDAPLLNFAAKHLGTEWLIVATNIPARRALSAYRKRWAIECMFGDAKTRGLNIEDTGLTDPRKSHGYFAQSWFRVGFDRLRNLLGSDHEEAVRPSRRLQKTRRKKRTR
jgi:hypothetical protein